MIQFCYQIIKSYLYFSNPSETHMYQLGKVRTFLNQFRTQYREQFHPLRMMSIDKIMIKTKSKFTKCKIRNPKKLIRNGIKIEALCDSRTGYFYTFHIHIFSNEDLLQVGSKTINIMVTLVSQLLFIGFQIIMDNYYSSIQTFRYLHNMKHNAIDTAQCNRITFELAIKKSTLRRTMN
jgi:hypothetical protein